MTRRCFYDLEFLEDGKTIDVISIGMVDDRGREFYAVNRNAPWARIAAHPWLMANVVPSLPQEVGTITTGDYNAAGVDLAHPHVVPRGPLARDVAAYLRGDGEPIELWAWYGAYDHVALCQLWGPMIDLPDGIPMFTMDLRQWQQMLGDPPLSEQAAGVHNALADARQNRVRWAELRGYTRRALKGLPLSNDDEGLTVPCSGECGNSDPHDAHLAPGALEQLGAPSGGL